MTEADIRAKVLAYGQACYVGGSRGELFSDLMLAVHDYGEQCFQEGEYVAINLLDHLPELPFD